MNLLTSQKNCTQIDVMPLLLWFFYMFTHHEQLSITFDYLCRKCFLKSPSWLTHFQLYYLKTPKKICCTYKTVAHLLFQICLRTVFQTLEFVNFKQNLKKTVPICCAHYINFALPIIKLCNVFFLYSLIFLCCHKSKVCDRKFSPRVTWPFES